MGWVRVARLWGEEPYRCDLVHTGLAKPKLKAAPSSRGCFWLNCWLSGFIFFAIVFLYRCAHGEKHNYTHVSIVFNFRGHSYRSFQVNTSEEIEEFSFQYLFVDGRVGVARDDWAAPCPPQCPRRAAPGAGGVVATAGRTRRASDVDPPHPPLLLVPRPCVPPHPGGGGVGPATTLWGGGLRTGPSGG